MQTKNKSLAVNLAARLFYLMYGIEVKVNSNVKAGKVFFLLILWIANCLSQDYFLIVL
jgi:hypothetical protein